MLIPNAANVNTEIVFLIFSQSSWQRCRVQSIQSKDNGEFNTNEDLFTLKPEVHIYLEPEEAADDSN